MTHFFLIIRGSFQGGLQNLQNGWTLNYSSGEKFSSLNSLWPSGATHTHEFWWCDHQRDRWLWIIIRPSGTGAPAGWARSRSERVKHRRLWCRARSAATAISIECWLGRPTLSRASVSQRLENRRTSSTPDSSADGVVASSVATVAMAAKLWTVREL